jgi:DNA-directed RNA polymerase subunit RPC12/RpoP
MNNCVDCGAEVAGTRCRPCNNRLLNRVRTDKLAEQDTWLLNQVDAGRKVTDLAQELSLTSAAVYYRLSKARRRRQAVVVE